MYIQATRVRYVLAGDRGVGIAERAVVVEAQGELGDEEVEAIRAVLEGVGDAMPVVEVDVGRVIWCPACGAVFEHRDGGGVWIRCGRCGAAGLRSEAQSRGGAGREVWYMERCAEPGGGAEI